jgi:hypothetical protein
MINIFRKLDLRAFSVFQFVKTPGPGVFLLESDKFWVSKEINQESRGLDINFSDLLMF